MLFYTTPTAGNLTLGSSGALLNASEHMQTFAKNLEKKNAHLFVHFIGTLKIGRLLLFVHFATF